MCWLGGVLLGLETNFAPAALYLLLGAAVLAGAAARALGAPWLPALLLPVLVLGVWRAEASEPSAQPLATQAEQQVVVEGRIADDPEATGRRTRFELSVTGIDRGGGMEPAKGRLLAYAEPSADLAYERGPPFFKHGDRLMVAGVLREPEPFDGFDYTGYLASQGISGVLWGREVELLAQDGGGWRSVIYSLRRGLSEGIEKAFPYPESALGQALLLGQRGSLPAELTDKFRGTGAAHLLAISGLHVGILMFAVLGAAAWALGRQRNYYLLVPLAAIWLYALISGGSPPVLRAAAMGTVYLAALGLGRPGSVLPALALSAALMTSFSPGLLRHVSFQLSFAAVGGIALAHTLVGDRLAAMGEANAGWRMRVLQPVASLTAISAAATLATWPLAAAHFQQVALLSIPVSLAAVPAMPLIIGGTLAAALAAVVSPPLGMFVGWIAALPVTYLIEIISAFPSWVWPVGGTGKALLAAWYGGLGLLLVAGQPHRLQQLWEHVKSWRPRLSLPKLSSPDLPPKLPALLLAVTATAAAAGLLWLRTGYEPDGFLHVFFLDVGQGDSILIVTPTGRQVLIDGGPDQESAARALSEALPPGDRSLDLVVLTHLDADHSRGLLEIVERFNIGAVLVGRDSPGAAMHAQWDSALSRRGIEAAPVSDGYRIELEPGVAMEVLNPSPDQSGAVDPNNDGVVVRLVHGSVSFLLAADIEAEAEERLSARGWRLASTVLKVPHHGSKTSSTPRFLEQVDPAIAVISVGRDNQFGHPHPTVIQRLQERLGAAAVYRTDQAGTVELITDGGRLWAETAQPQAERMDSSSYVTVGRAAGEAISANDRGLRTISTGSAE